ncbi:lipid A export permease/ATP-binding protein MsbA [Neptunomonas qingdaonensis]|uniref:ATP-binding cassette, subfamily B, MsbA n=1 Tax=Neptunomonas qingdaonensis TaxID=1045558 RepID=A0A1I2M1B5_9GAMM|nr:lipid A export permease/ATP-binding protein MsbA [Neptunomonas qingdaonensis]SFF84648.1 ATP-binding cassette, subfamily B, MsbA [Neptunomonas qingdaonensis]
MSSDKKNTDVISQDTTSKGWVVYKRLIAYAIPYWPVFTVAFVGYALYGASQAMSAKWLQSVVDSVEGGRLDERVWLALAVLGIFALRGVGTFLGNYCISYVARFVIHGLRTDLFDRMLLLPAHYYHHHSSGELLAQLTFNVEQVTGAVTDAVKILIREGLTVIGLFGYLFYLNWKLTLIFVAAAPFIGIVVRIASKRMRRLGHRIQKSVGDITSSASESIQGYQVVRVYGGTDFERQRFHGASDLNRRQFMKLVVAESINTPVVQFLVAMALAALMYLAMSPSVMGGMSTGEFVAFITAAAMVTKPLRLLTEINVMVQKGISAAQAVFNTMDQEEEKDGGTILADRVAGHLTFKQVAFAYPGSSEQVLSNFSLDIPQGKTVALVGKSGSGKSTVAGLIPRFNDGWTGEILLDGHALESYQMVSLREQIAIVSQSVVLFNGTIAENIAYGSMASASIEQIQAAAEAAHVMEFVARLPEGLQTQVGESGVLLSGGQRQRIAIARAILKDAPILIMDEATSALDTESERHIQSALEEVMKDRTTLVIAHRLSTIENADLIVVMDQGLIVEQGTHHELLQKDGAYAQLYKMQFGELADD